MTARATGRHAISGAELPSATDSLPEEAGGSTRLERLFAAFAGTGP